MKQVSRLQKGRMPQDMLSRHPVLGAMGSHNLNPMKSATYPRYAPAGSGSGGVDGMPRQHLLMIFSGIFSDRYVAPLQPVNSWHSGNRHAKSWPYLHMRADRLYLHSNYHQQ